ncbi:DUF4145 domain-containing protein [Empedobacter falsenii]|uniref:DUF4145 domain-containing protein n=2 Tax=Empedobacter TaxID=59734 RepID=A0A376G6G0_9FLAO|nr:DUF4145 domain-containing protein [Empedobacter falsenii]STD55914.1 Uncharacterised protein [Empedobacter falsenii]
MIGTIAQQKWWSIAWNGSDYHNRLANNLRISTCTHCVNNTLWIEDKMYFPDNGNVPFPNVEMPQSVKDIYLEAASVYSKSPRGAAALLRLGIQMLCKELGETGKNINADIAELVKKGLPEIVQQSLDIVRVTGNDAVHPGQIDTDDSEVVIQLFNLSNVIVEYMIALPKRVSGIYTSLPSDKIEAIKQRDKK